MIRPRAAALTPSVVCPHQMIPHRAGAKNGIKYRQVVLHAWIIHDGLLIFLSAKEIDPNWAANK